MGYVDSQLLPGEQVVYRSKLHWQVFFGPAILAALDLVGAAGLFSVKQPQWGFLLIAVAAWILLIPFIKRANSEFAVTNKRVVLKVGFFSTRTVELLHSKVEAISVDQGLLGRILDYGNITVTGSGGTKEVFSAVAAPLKLRNAVQGVSSAS